MIALNNIEITEQLFEAIDAIVQERIRTLPYDKTVIATITSISGQNYGKYQVTTDDNITFYAFSDVTTYNIGDKVYVRIPQNDYTKQKVITERYVPDSSFVKITEVKSSQLDEFKISVKNQLLKLQEQIDNLRNDFEGKEN